MRKILSVIFCVCIYFAGWSQTVTTDPVFPKADQPVTITVDVSGTTLDHFAWSTSNPVWIWSWISEGCSSGCDAPTNVNPATAAQDAAKMTRISTNPDKYQITFTPTTFFNKPASELKQIGLKLKSRNWDDGKQTDNNRFITFNNDFSVAFTPLPVLPLFKNQGEQITITAGASQASTITLKINGATVATAASATSINHTHTIAEAPGVSQVVVSGNNGTETKEASFEYIVRSAVVNQARPAGIVDGINYTADKTKVTLSLWAPDKTSVYVRGDFNNWKIDPAYQMKKAGEHFWIELTGLTEGQEYGFQYLVDETLWIADPYADKILDPDDQYIPASVYPSLKAFPTPALTGTWYFNRVAVFQTSQTAYAWQVTDFEKPAKEKLVVYELLVRDFFDSDHRSYQSLLDTISYFKRLGVNAIELMPIMEFNGNDSWGYNPAFMFAPDKYYGPKNKLKAFIDECHKEGIAVIFDIAMNHQDLPNAYVMMDFDFTAFKPKPTNKWFNPDAKHPFNVFYDMNHESSYTKKYLDTVNYYWLHEYKIDGFRFDLSKGFTQTNNPSNVDAWSAYDASRIAILKRMADKIWSHTPEAYVILEHLAVNSEEKELAEYRAGEGKGMMLWGNLNYAYNQNTMGFSTSSDISWAYAGTRGWSVPRAVSYMESHDEERLMFRNTQFGNTSGSYSTKTLATALDRMKAGAAFFFTIPGPKMLWQFGELGYDVSIDEGGRTGAKPVKWEYYENADRLKLFHTYEALIDLKESYDVFNTSDVTFAGNTTLTKQLTLKNQPYTAAPTTPDQMNVHVVGNFDVTAQSVSVAFPHTGKWYHYFSQGDSITVAASPTTLTLQPGEFRLYTDVKLSPTEPELMSFLPPVAPVLVSVSEVSKKIRLTWQDKSSLETQYTVYRGTSPTSFAQIGTTSKNVATYLDGNDLSPQVTYYYYVVASNAFGTGISDTLSVTTTDAVTAIEPNPSSLVSVYPNPSSGKFTIDANQVKIRSLRLFDVTGAEQKFTQQENELDITHLSNGLYILKIEDSQGHLGVKKLFKK